MTETSNLAPGNTTSPGQIGSMELSDEVIEKIIERVYQMLLAELRFEHERMGEYLSRDYHRGYG